MHSPLTKISKVSSALAFLGIILTSQSCRSLQKEKSIAESTPKGDSAFKPRESASIEETVTWFNQKDERVNAIRLAFLESLNNNNKVPIDAQATKNDILKAEKLALIGTGCQDEDLFYFSALKNLKILKLTNDDKKNKLTGKNLDYLSHLTKLKELDLDGNDIQAKDLFKLQGLKDLEQLTVYFNENMGNEGFEHLLLLPKLQSLTLSRTGLSKAAVPSLTKLADHESLSDISALQNPLLDDAVLETFAKFKKLQVLRIGGENKIEGDAFASLAKNPTLESFSIDNSYLHNGQFFRKEDLDLTKFGQLGQSNSLRKLELILVATKNNDLSTVLPEFKNIEQLALQGGTVPHDIDSKIPKKILDEEESGFLTPGTFLSLKNLNKLKILDVGDIDQSIHGEALKSLKDSNKNLKIEMR